MELKKGGTTVVLETLVRSFIRFALFRAATRWTPPRLLCGSRYGLFRQLNCFRSNSPATGKKPLRKSIRARGSGIADFAVARARAAHFGAAIFRDCHEASTPRVGNRCRRRRK